jgi:hypothetical protein
MARIERDVSAQRSGHLIADVRKDRYEPSAKHGREDDHASDDEKNDPVWVTYWPTLAKQ